MEEVGNIPRGDKTSEEGVDEEIGEEGEGEGVAS